MIELCDKNACTACAACVNICPQECISMLPDAEGFMFPEIDHSRCIECKACIKACPALTPVVHNPKAEKVLATFSTDDGIRRKSSSGGMFSVIAENIISDGGAVFGASFANSEELTHSKTVNNAGLASMRGSKYVQSHIKDTLKDVKKELDSGRKVLFSGTPCQIAGLNNFLGKKPYPNLLTVDIICHGVPSQRLLLDYADKLSAATGTTIKPADISFRKTDGWCTAPTAKGNLLKNEQNVFIRIFLQSFAMRECCYNCLYARQERVSDITIGDFWGIGENTPFEPDTDKGISLVTVNTEKGAAMLESVKKGIYCEQREWSEALPNNHQLHTPIKRPKKRNITYSYFFSHSLAATDRKFIRTPYARLRKRAGKILRKLKLRR